MGSVREALGKVKWKKNKEINSWQRNEGVSEVLPCIHLCFASCCRFCSWSGRGQMIWHQRKQLGESGDKTAKVQWRCWEAGGGGMHMLASV